jgi:hypothetical protein
MTPRRSRSRRRESITSRLLMAASALSTALLLIRSVPDRIRYTRVRRP